MHEICLGCGSDLSQVDGPVHPYMLSSAGCWQHYGEILAREYQNPKLFNAAHRLTVDAFALQHPGNANDIRANQSVRIHYISLFLIFEHGWTHLEATAALKKLVKRAFDPLPNPPRAFAITVADVWQAGESDHVEIVTKWAKCAFESWSPLNEFAMKTISELR